MSSAADEQSFDVFNYLSVVTSIILGLGLAHLLDGYARLIQSGNSLSVSWVYKGWVVVLLPLYVLYWWVFWDYRNRVHWTFLRFCFLLVGPVGISLVTSLLLPDTIEQARLDLNAHYLQSRRWLFGLWMMLQVWGILLAPWLKDGFKRASFLNRYKYAQSILLLALVAGFLSTTPLKPPFLLDGVILVIFWIDLIYLLRAHRWRLTANESSTHG
jgi:hypothetical protein